MNKIFLLFSLLALLVCNASASSIKGHVYDRKSGEAMPGATVSIAKTGKSTVTGLDGSFKISGLESGNYELLISYLGYQAFQAELKIGKEGDDNLRYFLEPEGRTLDMVQVASSSGSSSENEARRLEQRSDQVLNAVSGHTIQVSPDLTVANVIQRVSGVSIERNSNGDGQYAILRGMDKRYNYTLVNGVKVPSPDNKYRYVPLDIFPSDLLERLEVYKTLTANLEGDAVGGAVNMVMKDAPKALTIDANLATGYNQFFAGQRFMSYGYGQINSKSPYEVNGRSYQATQNDLPNQTLNYSIKRPSPNTVGSLTLGQRFMKDKLGVLLSGSYQNTFRGSNSSFYNSAVTGTDRFAKLTGESERQYSEQQKRYGLLGKTDYLINDNNKLTLSAIYVDLDNVQARDAVSTNFSTGYDPTAGNAELSYGTRTRFTRQEIFNGILHGDHRFMDNRLSVKWSGVYSTARNAVPDNTTISLSGVEKSFVQQKTVANSVTRRWERNTDEDRSGYLDLAYAVSKRAEVSAGGVYRDKQRSGFYNNYTLAPSDPTAVYGSGFNSYTDISWIVTNPTGAVANPLTYDASEKIAAGYGMLKLTGAKVDITAGARVEHTDQGYNLLFSAGELRPQGSQVYTDLLPSLMLKYHIDRKQQLHASYYRSLNRPGFYEIVPSKVVNEEYQERGNPDLQRAIADNYDLRYELFPAAGTQLLAGVFYKDIKNPIEYTFLADATRGQDTYYSPGNFGNATNYGMELDVVKFFNQVGIRANYTYTKSEITTPKDKRITDAAGNLQKISVNQTRPLYGQSAHIANASLLYKNNPKGIDAQLSGSYTGPRINTVSQFVDNDLWQEGFVQMDASAETRFKSHLSVFLKANNLLNTPTKLFIKGLNSANAGLAVEENGHTLIRSDYYKQSYLLGLRYKL